MSSLVLLKSMLFANSLQNKSKISQDIINIKKKKQKTKVSVRKKISNINDVMCRVCDQEKGEIPIFNNIVQPNIPEDILHFSSVTIDKADSLSKHMCQNCLDLLNGCVMFKEICQRTNEKLIEMSIKKEANMNIDGEWSEPERHGDSDDNNICEEFTDMICKFCGYEYFDSAVFASHKKICKKKVKQKPCEKDETTRKKFLCDICGKTSLSHASLLVHKTTHNPIFPFKCEECPYMGRTMDLLKVHKRTHLSEKPFKCPECAKTTTTASNLAKHIRHVHRTNKPFKCNYCEKAFSFQHDMKTHVKDIHLRQGTVECALCFKKFNTRKILRGHQWKVHKLKGEKSGRLPAYLQCQIAEQNGSHTPHEGEGETENKSSWHININTEVHETPPAAHSMGIFS